MSRIALAIVLMVMMGFGSAAADIHPVDAFDIECASADLAAQIIGLETLMTKTSLTMSTKRIVAAVVISILSELDCLRLLSPLT